MITIRTEALSHVQSAGLAGAFAVLWRRIHRDHERHRARWCPRARARTGRGRAVRAGERG